MSEADVDTLRKTLEVLYSFRSGRPDPKDFQYVDFQRKESGMNYPSDELTMGWLHYLLYNNHGIKIDVEPFGNRVIPSLLRDGLIDLTPDGKSDPSLDFLKEAHLSGHTFPLLDNPITITEKGISYLGKTVSNDDSFTFDNKKGALIFRGQECILPAFKNEHAFCRFAFGKYEVNQPFDWEYAYQDMLGSEVTDATKNRRAVYDATEALNSRVKEMWGGGKLFEWEGKAIRRLR